MYTCGDIWVESSYDFDANVAFVLITAILSTVKYFSGCVCAFNKQLAAVSLVDCVWLRKAFVHMFVIFLIR